MRTVVLLALLVAGVFSQTTNITSVRANGIDVIVLDSPSWVTHIQKSWGQHEFFVFGENTLRTINSGVNSSSFYAMPVTDPWNFPLVDLHSFWNNGSLWTFGLTDFTPDGGSRFSGISGPYVPFFTAITSPNSTLQSAQSVQTPYKAGLFDFRGYLTYALKVDWTSLNTDDIITYFAGFVITDSATVQFTLTRTHFDPDYNQFNQLSQEFVANPNDIFPIYNNMFTSFSNVFRPWIHFLPQWGPLNHTFVIVVDPNSRGVYGIDVDATFNPNVTTPPSSFLFENGFSALELVSTSFDGQLILGFAASGFAPGILAIFTFDPAAYTIPTPVIVTLPMNYSNPKALTSDSEYLYIGMNGYSEVLQFYLGNNTVVGYQRLPDYLHRSWDATMTNDHVYFVTYEQNSKVFRIAKHDFCPVACPYNGYCVAGKCVCSYSYVMTSDKTLCLLQASREIISIQHHYITAHRGEVALGILFALSFVAAAAGWFMWWRGRGHAYRSV